MCKPVTKTAKPSPEVLLNNVAEHCNKQTFPIAMEEQQIENDIMKKDNDRSKTLLRRAELNCKKSMPDQPTLRSTSDLTIACNRFRHRESKLFSQRKPSIVQSDFVIVATCCDGCQTMKPNKNIPDNKSCDTHGALFRIVCEMPNYSVDNAEQCINEDGSPAEEIKRRREGTYCESLSNKKTDYKTNFERKKQTTIRSVMELQEVTSIHKGNEGNSKKLTVEDNGAEQLAKGIITHVKMFALRQKNYSSMSKRNPEQEVLAETEECFANGITPTSSHENKEFLPLIGEPVEVLSDDRSRLHVRDNGCRFIAAGVRRAYCSVLEHPRVVAIKKQALRESESIYWKKETETYWPQLSSFSAQYSSVLPQDRPF